MSELKACPFCGKPIELVGDDFLLGFSWIHETNGICPLERTVNDSGWTYSSKDVMVKTFNTRPIEDALNQRIAELEAQNAMLRGMEAFKDRKIDFLRDVTNE